MHSMQFTVALSPQSDGGFTVQCLEIPGAISEGDDEAQALANIQDAIREILAARRDLVPVSATVRTVDVDA